MKKYSNMKRLTFLYFLYFMFIPYTQIISADREKSNCHEKLCIHDEDYNKQKRPNPDETKIIMVDIRDLQILHIDDNRCQVHFKMYLDLRWTEPRLDWSDMKVGKFPTVFSKYIWKPDLFIDNVHNINNNYDIYYGQLFRD